MSLLFGQVMPFVHPGVAGLAMATGLIPVLVHLINRRRYVRVRWAAMSFLVAANRRTARRVWLEELLLLLTRVTLIVLFGLAVARPFLPSSSALAFRSSGVHRVILLDNSLSMDAGMPDEASRFELAKRCAQGLLGSFAASDGVSIVTLARPAEAVIAEAAYDRRFARERLFSIHPTQRSTDTVGALDIALDLLRESRFPEANRAVYLISDLPNHIWSGDADRPTAAMRALARVADALVDSGADLTVVVVADDATPNTGITSLAVESPLVGVDMPVQVTTQVTNFGTSTVRGAELQVRRDGQIIRREKLRPLEPGGTSVTLITLEFAAPGTHVIETRLSGLTRDALAHDDARFLSIEVRETAPVLLVDGRPGATKLAGQAGFLATALAPRVAPTDAMLLSPAVITYSELAGEALSSFDVVVLCNVRRLSEAAWRRLEGFVDRGGGLFVFAGDLVSVDHYNRLGYRAGEGLLPGRLARSTVDPSERAQGLTIAPSRLDHPVVRAFADHPESGLFLARVDRYLPIEPDPQRAEVLLRYSDDAPALVASAYGKGRVLLCTTTANMDWTNLPAKGDYVSLMLSAMAHLAPRHGGHRNVLVGDRLREPLTPAETSMPLRVVSGDRASAEPALVPDGETLALEYGPIQRARVLTISIGATTRHFVANVDPEESDLTSIDEGSFRAALGKPVRMIRSSEALDSEPVAARSAELASTAMYVVAGLLFLEMAMALWFGAGRSEGRRGD